MKTILVFLTNLALFTSCAAGKPETMNRQTDAIAIINRYVAEHKHWTPHQYRIDTGEQTGRVTVYVVVYLEDERNAIPGGGKSFEVEYDPVGKRVVRELGLQ